MFQFLQENRGAIISLLVMAVYWFILNFRSVKGNVKAIDKMRVEKGMAPMTDDENRIVIKVLHSSVIGDTIGPFIGGIVALIVVNLLA